MSSFRSRPRFKQIVDTSPEITQEKIEKGIDLKSERFELKSFPNFICLRIAEKDRHFWSPRLNMSIDPTDDGKTTITGIYGPNANVWSLFMFSYLFVGLFAAISAVLTISQWVIESPPWGIWPLSITLVILVALYIIAQIGQKLGAQQTFLLHQTYESAMNESIIIH